jgi:hypothetical protein
MLRPAQRGLAARCAGRLESPWFIGTPTPGVSKESQLALSGVKPTLGLE